VTYSFLNVTQTVNLSGQLEIVLQPDLLGFVPTLGEKFDLITAAGGITLNPNLQLIDLVTVAADSYVSQLPVSVFNSGITNDPDHLFQINETVFDVALVDNNTTLEATVVEELAVPEPASIGGLILLGSAAMMRRRRRRA
jgi:hypothetical protein